MQREQTSGIPPFLGVSEVCLHRSRIYDNPSGSLP
jgi:hypothetical protein